MIHQVSAVNIYLQYRLNKQCLLSLIFTGKLHLLPLMPNILASAGFDLGFSEASSEVAILP